MWDECCRLHKEVKEQVREKKLAIWNVVVEKVNVELLLIHVRVMCVLVHVCTCKCTCKCKNVHLFMDTCICMCNSPHSCVCMAHGGDTKAAYYK